MRGILSSFFVALNDKIVYLILTRCISSIIIYVKEFPSYYVSTCIIPPVFPLGLQSLKYLLYVPLLTKFLDSCSV